MNDQDSETIPVRPAHRFATGRLRRTLGDDVGTGMEVRQMRGGQSNPTFMLPRIGASSCCASSRRGKLLPSAHAVDREYRVLSALAETDVPVPRAAFFATTATIVGTPFYVMERMQGRVFWSPTLPGAAEGRAPRDLYRPWTRSRSCIRSIAAPGLADYGKPGSYFARQIARWTKQWEGSQTARVNPSIDKLVAWLPKNIPEGDRDRVVHGDFPLRQYDVPRDRAARDRRCSIGNCRRSAIRWRISPMSASAQHAARHV